ncbi:binary toxin-like calcium binding domain-containing protein [Clostridioides difficile]|uniref:binary toxin-like calcium binding domain-containing protein n=1 Tax=Clostridioides difficile TaxID=1496 RepID=UPI0021C56D2C|nr:binary toxin-like calcium binding domain-containing protein [Clostridioides difficile]UUV16763.1 PA14 domain-containing protein [Clostridioides difficile]
MKVQMKNKKLLSFLTLTAIVSQALAYPVYAQTTAKPQPNQKREVASEETLPNNGLMGYYFADEHFRDLEVMAPIKNGNLKFEEKKVDKLLDNDKSAVKSIRWTGRIIPSEDGEYTLSTDRDDVLMQVNAEGDVANTLKVNMKKGKEYKVRIELQDKNLGSIDNLSSPKLYWESNGNKVVIPEENLFLRDYSKIEKNDPFIPKNNFFDPNLMADWEDEDLDTDNDNIPDAYEKNGYTIKDLIAVKWEDSFAEQGYKKYVSNYLEPNTAGDPYTDYEKSAGTFDRAISKEARDPLVAAYPIVGVGMEKLILSTNDHVSTDQGKSVSRSTTNSKTDANTVGVAISAGYQNGFTGSVTANYSHTTDNTTAVQDSKGESWNTGLQISKSESAYINANVRYYNTGTAPMYKVTPTTNLVLDGDTLSTIKAQENQIGNNLSPNSTYPKKGVSPLALNTMDQFSSRLIPINYEQLKKLDAGKDIKLETTQVSGNFGIKNSHGQIVTEGNSWSDYISQVDSISASLILDTGDGTYERRVAAKDSYEPEDKTPQLTVGQAIEKAFGATKKDGLLYFNGTPIDESCVELVFDDYTANTIKERLRELDDKKIYNVKLERGMNILIKTPTYFTNFDGYNNYPNVLSNLDTNNKDGLQGAANKLKGETKITIPMSKLKPYKRYVFSGYSKDPSASNSITVKIKAKEQKTDYLVPEKDYTKFSYEFETTGKDSSDVEITLSGSGTTFLDNLSITELNSTPEVLKEPEVKVPTNQEIIDAHKSIYPVYDPDMQTGDVYVNGIYFEPTQTNKEALDFVQKYRVEATLQYSGFKDIGTKDKEIRNYGGDVNQPKTNYVNLLSYYTNLERVMTNSKLKIYAITQDNREIEVFNNTK